MHNSHKQVLFGKRPTPVELTDDFNRADGGLGADWIGDTWTISTNKAINTPVAGSELVVNGSFTTDTTWTKGTGWTIAAGAGAYASVPSAQAYISQNVLTAGKVYRANGDVGTLTNATAFLAFGNNVLTGPPGTSTGTITTTACVEVGTKAGLLGVSAGNAAIALDNVTYKELTISELFATYFTNSSSYSVSAKVTLGAATEEHLTAGLVIGLDSPVTPLNYVLVFLSNNKLHVEKCVAGVFSNVTDLDCTYSAGKVLRVDKTGDQMRAIYDGVQITGTITPAAAGVIQNNAYFGLFSTGPAHSFDDFVGAVQAGSL